MNQEVVSTGNNLNNNNNSKNNTTVGSLSSSSCSSTSTTTTVPPPPPLPSHPPPSQQQQHLSNNSNSYSLRAKQQLKLAQMSEMTSISPSDVCNGNGVLDCNEDRSSINGGGTSSGTTAVETSCSSDLFEKENDSGIEKDDANNTILVRVAINDQSLQVNLLYYIYLFYNFFLKHLLF